MNHKTSFAYADSYATTFELTKEATDLRQQFLKSIESNELIQRLKQCSDIIAGDSNANDKASTDEKYQALVFNSENEEWYEFMRNNCIFENMTATQDLSFVYLFEDHSYDFYEISEMIANEFPSCAKFKTDFAYIMGNGVGKISIAQMDQCIRFVLETPYEDLHRLGID